VVHRKDGGREKIKQICWADTRRSKCLIQGSQAVPRKTEVILRNVCPVASCEDRVYLYRKKIEGERGACLGSGQAGASILIFWEAAVGIFRPTMPAALSIARCRPRRRREMQVAIHRRTNFTDSGEMIRDRVCICESPSTEIRLVGAGSTSETRKQKNVFASSQGFATITIDAYLKSIIILYARQ
jgi:hypothetical protein